MIFYYSCKWIVFFIFLFSTQIRAINNTNNILFKKNIHYFFLIHYA